MKMKRFSSTRLQITNVRAAWKRLKNAAVCFIVIAGLFCTGVPAHSVFAAEIDSETPSNSSASPICVYIDNERISFDSEPELFDGTTMVPMRQIFEQLGAEIEWNGELKEVTAVCGLDRIRLRIGSDAAIHNNEVSLLTHAPYIKNGRTMVPLRYLSEALSYDVSWDAKQRRVDIKKKAAVGAALPGEGKEEESRENEPKPSSSGEGTAVSILGENAQLTYNDAMKKTISSSSACKEARLSLKQAQQQLDEFYDLYSLNYTIAIMQTRKDLSLLTDWSERNVVVTEGQTAYSIKNAMDDISLKLIEIENQKAAVSYAKKGYQTDNIRFEAGAISQKTLNASRDNLTAAEKKLSSMKTELEGLYITLNRALGSDEYESDYPVEYDISYEPVGDIDLKAAFDDAKENDPYLWYLQNSVDNADFKLQTYEYNMGGKSYTLTQMDLTKARINFNTTKSNLEKVLRSRYNQLQQLESNIGQLEDQKAILEENIDTLWTLYDAGMQSRQALEEAVQNEGTIAYSLLSLKINHEHLKAIFEKPYLAPEYMAG